MAFIRESELLFGDDSLLAVYGPLIAEICANPAKYQVRAYSLPLLGLNHPQER
jgi:condensin complex subunit 1